MPSKKTSTLAIAEENRPQPSEGYSQADHESFLGAFEKPTQIYRFLRSRSITSPLFLNRTLIYMNQHYARVCNGPPAVFGHKKTSRNKFKIDDILQKVSSKRKSIDDSTLIRNEQLSLFFTGFTDNGSDDSSSDDVIVELYLLHVLMSKRKEIQSPINKMFVGKCKVPSGASTGDRTKCNGLSISPEKFKTYGTHHPVKSHVIVFKVRRVYVARSSDSTSVPNGMAPPLGELNSNQQPLPKKFKHSDGSSDEHSVKEYVCELVVYDKTMKCMVPSAGDYQLTLNEVPNFSARSASRRNAQWVEQDSQLESAKVIDSLDDFNKSTVLKFRLAWTDTPVVGQVTTPTPYVSVNPAADGSKTAHQNGRPKDQYASPGALNSRNQTRIFYHFLFNKKTKQHTECKDDFRCPWCYINCFELYSLLKHLKLCHPRFAFSYVPHSTGARIDVVLNECFDGSYAGNPMDLLVNGCDVFGRRYISRRVPITTLLVFKPKRGPQTLSEFIEADEMGLASMEENYPRLYSSGHNRLYYHTTTCIPIRPQEFDMDSEAENDPSWLQDKTKSMIDEFTDVNEGEKELMKMWNLHVMRLGFVGDCQMPLACQMFVQCQGKEILRKHLYRNFMLHLCSLYNFGLISAAGIYKTVRQLQGMAEHVNLVTALSE